VQFFQRIFFDHDPDIIPKRVNTGASIFFSVPVVPKLTAELLFASSLDQSNWMLRPKLVWKPATNWLVAGGVDAFGGEQTSVFGQYKNSSRVWANARYSF